MPTRGLLLNFGVNSSGYHGNSRLAPDADWDRFVSFEHNLEVARRLAGMDHISGGRVIWNVVSSSAALRRHEQLNGHPDEDALLRAAAALPAGYPETTVRQRFALPEPLPVG